MDSVPAAGFGQLLRRHRLEAGLSQDELAERAGLSTRGVSDLERGRRTSPRAETVRLLAGALELNPMDRAALVAAAHPELSAPMSGSGSRGLASPAPATRIRFASTLMPPTRLIGRDADVERVGGLLRRDEVRLVTLTGPGGVGKTRLAMAVAADLGASGRFIDGVTLVELAPVREPDLVASAIAAALGIKESGNQPLAGSLSEALKDRRMLLVLDNFEHVLPSALLVAGLLASCPGLVILATSRERLHLRGEREMAVEPLAMPAVPDPATPASLASLAGVASVSLLIDRAGDADLTFTLTIENAPAIAGLCRTLDGLPLAIELAAPRLKLLSPQALLTRLTHRLPVLTDGPRDLPARQQTLCDTIAWSYELLTPAEQALFRQVAVFAAGTSLEAIEVVADSPGTGELELEVFAGLERLVDQSLLRQVATAGESRFDMLETIREFGLEQLDVSGEANAVHGRHMTFFLALAQAAEPLLTGPSQRQWLERLEAEHDNLRAALSWALAHTPETALKLAANLWRFWYVRSHLVEGRDWLERVLAAATLVPTRARAMALHGASVLASAQYDPVRARVAAADALECFSTIGDQTGVAHALNALGDAESIPGSGGSLERAATHYNDALGLFRTEGHQRGVAVTLTNLGNLAWDRDELDLATDLHGEALVRYREFGDDRGIAWSLNNLGLLDRERGELARAFRLLNKALGLYVTIGDRNGIAEALEGLGSVVDITTEAARLLGAAETLRQVLGTPLSLAKRSTNVLIVDSIRVVIGEDAFSAAWEAGQRASIEEAVATALAMTKDGSQNRGEPGAVAKQS